MVNFCPILPDEDIRKQALDPCRSFIVQAPAGSGKTELLIQRFLVLLACAEKAEEVIAITFTRKAASEMRQRVLDALEQTQLPMPNESHARQTWELAQKVLLQDNVKNWRLLDNPQRLQIQTIDALCSHLTRRMPLLSGFGSSPNILEDPRGCYLEAARRLIAMLENDDAYCPSLAHLLLHLNNDVSLLETLFIDMLGKRDQWLPYLMAYHQNHSSFSFRKMLEDSLKHIIFETLSKCHEAIPTHLQHELMTLLRFAAVNLSELKSEYLAAQCQPIEMLLSPDIEHHKIWLAVSDLLLTEGNTWRKTVNKNNGFPPENKEMKARMLSLLEALSANDALREKLAAVKICPPPTYTEMQWQTVKALIELLPILAAQLNVVFGEKNVADFTEITLAAIRALGDLDSPSELALILDYQIRHFLIDEFQDTSTTQFRLLTHLISGWENADNRTLFLVGDPMQSIYRFREAEVGLFLKAQQEGIGHIQLTPLFLTANFRSTPTIVDWINQQFKKIFPENADISSGAVSFNESVATKNKHDHSGIYIHPHLNVNDQIKNIIDIIKKEHLEHPHRSIAILVRSRTHLVDIIPALKKAELTFTAVDIESLKNQSITHDLIALTTALLRFDDRAAWLSILRAPWCGLKLHDLYALSAENHHCPLWETLQTCQCNTSLSHDGKLRLKKMLAVLSHSLDQRQRLPLRTWIEQTWKALGGVQCLSNYHELATSKVFFSVLEEMDTASDLVDLAAFSQKLNEKFATPENIGHHALHIMTIHKAKGLEFDTVIIPHLEGKSRSESERLLRWLDRPRPYGTNDLLLAPIKSKDEKEDPIYKYLYLTETKKIQYEMARLLYVAITRTKKTLHLLANVNSTNTEKPLKDSFLSLINDSFEEKMTFLNFNQSTDICQSYHEEIKERVLRRLPIHEIEKNIPTHPKEIIAVNGMTLRPDDDLTIQNHKHIGIVIHRILQKITQTSLNEWTEHKMYHEKIMWRKWLLSLGTSLSEVENSVDIIFKMIMLTLDDPRGKWILQKRHEQASELQVTTVLNGVPTPFIIDRTFVDDQQTRWIIDYKTGSPEYEDIDLFLDQAQKTHREQLQRYALAVEKIDVRPIRLGLYFPACSGWREWPYARSG